MLVAKDAYLIHWLVCLNINLAKNFSQSLEHKNIIFLAARVYASNIINSVLQKGCIYLIIFIRLMLIQTCLNYISYVIFYFLVRNLMHNSVDNARDLTSL